MKTCLKAVLNTVLLIAVALLFTHCDNNDLKPQNEKELIVTFTPQAGGSHVVYNSQNGEGDGTIDPTLNERTTYAVSIEVRNIKEDKDLTEEIEAENTEYQFFIQTSSDLDLAFDYADSDDNGNPIGLSTIFVARSASSGTMTVTLRHEPIKSADGVADGDITNADGETDIEATFDVVIE